MWARWWSNPSSCSRENRRRRSWSMPLRRPARPQPWPPRASACSISAVCTTSMASIPRRRTLRGCQIPPTRHFIPAPIGSSESKRPWRFPAKPCARSINRHSDPRAWGCAKFLGYAPIQPDGSVQVQVPANVPFTIDIVDVNAKRVTAQHTSWLQLLPGETKTCNGCHTTANMTSHGRAGLTNPVNPGAPATGSPFPNTNPAIALTNAGADHGADAGAQHLYGQRYDPERRHHALLADLELRRDLRRHLDRRHHAAAGRYAVRLSVVDIPAASTPLRAFRRATDE